MSLLRHFKMATKNFPQILFFKFQILFSKFQISNFIFQILFFKFQILFFKFQILFFKFYFSNFIFRILFFKFYFSNFIFQILFFKLYFSNFKFYFPNSISNFLNFKFFKFQIFIFPKFHFSFFRNSRRLLCLPPVGSCRLPKIPLIPCVFPWSTCVLPRPSLRSALVGYGRLPSYSR